MTERTCHVPTPRAWILIGLSFLLITILLVQSIHPFLAQTEPAHGELLIVEGWLPDYSLEQALHAFRTGHYVKMVTTGEPLLRGYYLASHKTHAELARSILLAMGAGSDSVIAVPSVTVRMDRTYAAALAVRRWLTERGESPEAVDVFSYGSHARRSRVLFQKAMGDSIQVGVYSGADRGYDAAEWWASSRGFQDVIMETIGYVYASIWSPSDE